MTSLIRKLLFASWFFTVKIGLTAAYPQISDDDVYTENDNDVNGDNHDHETGQNDFHSIDHATLLINNERKEITERTTPLDPPLDVGSAMIIDAPHGSGCFFSRSVTDEQSRLDNTLVSQTFYNTGRQDLAVPFPAASSVTCFMIPYSLEEGTGGDEAVALWLESSSTESDSSLEDETRYELKFLSLLRESRPYALGIRGYDEPATLTGAAVVYASRPEAGCLAMEYTPAVGQASARESSPMAQDGPLSNGPPPSIEPVLDEEPPPEEPIDSDENFKPAGRVQYFALGNPMLEPMQAESIHCFGNQKFENGQT